MPDGSEEPAWVQDALAAEPQSEFPSTRNCDVPPFFEDDLKKVFAERATDLPPGLIHILRELWSLGVAAGARGCERCNNPDGCEPESADTSYHWDGEGENPNRYQVLCRDCAQMHHEYWDEMWREYYASQGF
jgi:hypothetical protein